MSREHILTVIISKGFAEYTEGCERKSSGSFELYTKQNAVWARLSSGSFLLTEIYATVFHVVKTEARMRNLQDIRDLLKALNQTPKILSECIKAIPENIRYLCRTNRAVMNEVEFSAAICIL